MSKVEMVVTGLMAWGFCCHFAALAIAELGPMNHPVTEWCRKVMLVQPTRRTLEIWQDWVIPVVYLAAAGAAWYFGWISCAVFTLFAALTCLLRSYMMRQFPARNYKPKQLHPLCHWM
jgi:hypothetical protein